MTDTKDTSLCGPPRRIPYGVVCRGGKVDYRHKATIVQPTSSFEFVRFVTDVYDVVLAGEITYKDGSKSEFSFSKAEPFELEDVSGIASINVIGRRVIDRIVKG